MNQGHVTEAVAGAIREKKYVRARVNPVLAKLAKRDGFWVTVDALADVAHAWWRRDVDKNPDAAERYQAVGNVLRAAARKVSGVE